MKQYYVLARDQIGELYRWFWPAENIEDLVNKFKHSDIAKGQEIINFAVRISGQAEPDWFKKREPEKQLEFPFEDVVNL